MSPCAIEATAIVADRRAVAPRRPVMGRYRPCTADESSRPSPGAEQGRRSHGYRRTGDSHQIRIQREPRHVPDAASGRTAVGNRHGRVREGGRSAGGGAVPALDQEWGTGPFRIGRLQQPRQRGGWRLTAVDRSKEETVLLAREIGPTELFAATKA